MGYVSNGMQAHIRKIRTNSQNNDVVVLLSSIVL